MDVGPIDKPARASSANRWFLVLMLAAFAGLRVLAAVHSPVHNADTASYTRLDFLGGTTRLWTVPLLWKILPTDGLREAAQLVIGITAWSALAWSVSDRLTRPSVRHCSVVAVLMLGLVPQVAGWDGTLLSESLSTSLLVLLTALLLRLTRSQSQRLLGSALLVAMLWVFARHVNVLIYLAILPFVVLFTVKKLPKRSASLITIALLAIALWGGFAITRQGDLPVWRANALSIVVDRIGRDPSALRFFAARGFPSADLMAQNKFSLTFAAIHLSHDQRMMGWITHQFRGAYLAYVVRHWPGAIGGALTNAPTFISAPLPIGKARAVLPAALSRALWGTSPVSILRWTALAAGLVLAAMLLGAGLDVLPVVALLLLMAVIASIVIWNTTDPAMILARQFLPVAVTLRLALLLGVAFSLDALPAVAREWSWSRMSRRAGLAAPRAASVESD